MGSDCSSEHDCAPKERKMVLVHFFGGNMVGLVRLLYYLKKTQGSVSHLTSLGIVVPRRSSRAAAHGPSPTKPTSPTSHNTHTVGLALVPTPPAPVVLGRRSPSSTPPRNRALAHACSSIDRCSPPPRRPHLWPSRTRTKDSIAQPQWTLTSARSEHLRRRLHMSPAPPRELLVPPAG